MVQSYSFSDIRQTTASDFSRDVQNNLARTVNRSSEQLSAWDISARWVHSAVSQLDAGHDNSRVVFEHQPPLHDIRSDLLIVTKNHLLVIEAKTGLSESATSTNRQLNEYASILHDLIYYDRERTIVQIALRNNAPAEFNVPTLPATNAKPTLEGVIDLRPEHLGDVLQMQVFEAPNSYEETDPKKWLYSPRPDVVRSGTALLSEMSDKGVLTALTDDEELERVVNTCRNIIRDVQSGRALSPHAVIAITGVPGAGKTLVGLRLTGDKEITELTQKADGKTSRPLYLSGNTTLVDVIKESIARDRHRLKPEETLTQARATADSLIRSVHTVTEKGLQGLFHVLVFDEAQRAWTAEKMLKESDKRDLQSPDSDDQPVDVEVVAAPVGSEPEELMKLLEDPRLPWSVVICLIGTGQEIHAGEDGLSTWAVAVDQRKSRGVDWTMYANSNTVKKEKIQYRIQVQNELHLETVRRAENASQLGDWVDLLLSGDVQAAATVRERFSAFPIVATRNLDVARKWVRSQVCARSQTYGLLASSQSKRLHAYGVRVIGSSESFNWVDWYLDDPPNLNSSRLLEVAAPEYHCQGLELDYTLLCWSWDLVAEGQQWRPRYLGDRKGAKWYDDDAEAKYSRNTYRVLLTRARQGMAIWVPEGDMRDQNDGLYDPSRNPAEMNAVFERLIQAGCKELAG